MRYSWIENGVIRDIAQGDPNAIYHPDVALHYSEQVPDSAENGDLWDGLALTKPVVPEPVVVVTPVVPPTITKTHFLLTFTSAERVKARALRATDPVLDDFWMILDITDTVNLSLPSVQNGVEYTLAAVKAGGLTTLDVATRKAEILAGKLQ